MKTRALAGTEAAPLVESVFHKLRAAIRTAFGPVEQSPGSNSMPRSVEDAMEAGRASVRAGRAAVDDLMKLLKELGEGNTPGYTKEAPPSSPADTPQAGMVDLEIEGIKATVPAYLLRGPVGESDKPGYTGEHGGTVGDEKTILHAASDLLSRIYPRERVEKALGDLAAAERETTGRATAAPRPDWIEARKQPGKVADLLAQFVRAKFADELAAGTMSTQTLYRYEGLHRAFYNHKDKLPPDLQDMPTRSEVYDRMVAEGNVTPAEAVRLVDRDRKRIAAARSRGVAVRAAS
jgi:hypothetical protein